MSRVKTSWERTRVDVGEWQLEAKEKLERELKKGQTFKERNNSWVKTRLRVWIDIDSHENVETVENTWETRWEFSRSLAGAPWVEKTETGKESEKYKTGKLKNRGRKRHLWRREVFECSDSLRTHKSQWEHMRVRGQKRTSVDKSSNFSKRAKVGVSAWELKVKTDERCGHFRPFQSAWELMAALES